MTIAIELPNPTVDVLGADYDGSTALPNPKHELYARMLAQGIPAVDAHHKAGYRNIGNSKSSNAIEDARRPDIAKRTVFLRAVFEASKEEVERAKVAVGGVVEHLSPEAAGFTALYVLQQFQENLITARCKGDIRLANDTVKLIGEVLGLFGDSKQKGGVPVTSTQIGRPRNENDSVSDPTKVFISFGANLDAAAARVDRPDDQALRDITPGPSDVPAKPQRVKRHPRPTEILDADSE